MTTQAKGFSLFDALITLAVLSILVSLAAPSLAKFRREQAIHQAEQRLFNLMNQARSLAVMQGAPAIICRSHDTYECQDTGKHWILFSDSNNNKRRDDTESLHHQWTPKDAQLRVRIQASGRQPFIRYHTNGRAQPFGSVYLCDNQFHLSRQLVTSIQGRNRIQADPNATACGEAAPTLGEDSGA